MWPMASLLSIEEALARVLARARPLEPEPVAVEEAAGRVLAEDVAARVDLPPFASSAMDGYAIRAADAPGRLPVVARVAAGVPATRALTAGEAMEISTGGAVPEGADSVVPIEVVAVSDNEIDIGAPVDRGRPRSSADRCNRSRPKCGRPPARPAGPVPGPLGACPANGGIRVIEQE